MMIRPTIPAPVAASDDHAPASIPGDRTVAAIPAAKDELSQRVRLFLNGSNVPGLRHVGVEVEGNTVTLRGAVRTFYEKQLAVRLCRRVAGVIQVIDLVEAVGYRPRGEREGTDVRPAADKTRRPR